MASKTAKMAPREPKMAASCIQEDPGSTQDDQDYLKAAHEAPREASKTTQTGLQEILQEGPKRQQSLFFGKCLKKLGARLRSAFPTAQDGPRGNQDRTQSTQEPSEMAL